ncbi:MAG: helix-turn-helix domain-containing protein [Euryarchaeota archaeon]|nr:helix-turn-helix domain-containing protein [Euryarchaeota archaeon]
MHEERQAPITVSVAEDAKLEAGEPTPNSPAGMLTRIQTHLLSLENRRRILQRIHDLPGIHLRRLGRELGLAIGTVEPHLHLLEQYGLVLSHLEGKRRSYYAKEQVRPEDLPLLHHLRHRTWRKLLVDLLAEPGLTFSALSKRLPCRPSTVAYHLERLVRAGLVARTAVGRNAFYEVADTARMERLLSLYGSTFRGLVGRQQDLVPPDRPSLAASEADDAVFSSLLSRLPSRRGPRPHAAP